MNNEIISNLTSFSSGVKEDLTSSQHKTPFKSPASLMKTRQTPKSLAFFSENRTNCSTIFTKENRTQTPQLDPQDFFEIFQTSAKPKLTPIKAPSSQEQMQKLNFSGKRENYRKLNLKSQKKGNLKKKYYGNYSKNKNNNTSDHTFNQHQLPKENEVISSSSSEENDLVNNNEENKSDDEDLMEIEQPLFIHENFSENSLNAYLSFFNFSSFKEGQLYSIQRILSGQNTLLLSPTGSGKSLCYQMVSLIFKKTLKKTTLGIIISPLISLIQDQISRIPDFLKAEFLSSQLNANEEQQVYQKIIQGEVDLLFMSPERLNNKEFLKNCSNFPEISFACVDEAHCISEWSHNFRTSYLFIFSKLKKLKIGSVLALTATATLKTEENICQILNIPKEGVVRISAIPKNLFLNVLMDKNENDRINQIFKIVTNEKLKNESIIIYCNFRVQTEKIVNEFKNSRTNLEIMAYHAGLSSKERTSIQKKFMTGKVKIIAATVAFGMGLNHSSIRCIIHYSLPRSLENYTQEIGRAGRDGKESYCYVFIHPIDYYKNRSLAFSEGVDRFQIKELMGSIFYQNKDQYGKIPLPQAENDYDIKKEVIQTILSYLQLCKSLRIIPRKQEFNNNQNIDGFYYKKYETSFRTFDQIQENIYQKLREIETTQVLKIDIINQVLMKAFEISQKQDPNSANQFLHQNISDYFSKQAPSFDEELKDKLFSDNLKKSNNSLLTDINLIIKSYDKKITQKSISGRVISRILHGISSPSFSWDLLQQEWKSVWGHWKNIDFRDLVKISTNQILLSRKVMNK